MKILICSYADLLNGTTEPLINALKVQLPDAEVIIKPYINSETLIQDLKGVIGLMTYFIPLGEDVLSAASDLKYISNGSTGFSNIDLDAASRYGIKVSTIKEYCTAEVADHTLALILSLARKITSYDNSVRSKKIWDYAAEGKINRLSAHTLAIYGLGRIGQAVAKRTKSFGINVIAYDPLIPASVAESIGVELVDNTTVLKEATIISNHMNATEENTDFFNAEYFNALKNPIIFINVSRGQSVDEAALLDAVNSGNITSAGIDVLKSESPDLDSHPLIGHDKILVTPHAAFYSEEAMADCDRIFTMNIVHSLRGEHEAVFAYVN